MAKLPHFLFDLFQILSCSKTKDAEQSQGECFAAKQEVAAIVQHFLEKISAFAANSITQSFVIQ